MKHTSFAPSYVDSIPANLEGGVLYISLVRRTASHLCPCGCESRVVTPLKPAKWQITERDGLVSLWPSIGLWQKPCQSHYWIRDNEVVWSRAFTQREIRSVQKRDAAALSAYYANRRGWRGIRVRLSEQLRNARWRTRR